MPKQNDLFGKTFDQQVIATGGDIDGKDITPNRRIAAEIVFEPMMTGIRVTARDREHRLLWGFVADAESVNQVHCLVAVYETLQTLVGEELRRGGFPAPALTDPVKDAQQALGELERTVSWLRRSLDVKKVTPPTLERARAIARIASDANQQVTLEATALKGMKPRADRPLPKHASE